MKIIRSSNAQEVVLYWLIAELNSTRFSRDLHLALNNLNCNEKIITNANLNNANENKLRLQVLHNYRGWLDRDFNDYIWQFVELDNKDVANLNYIDYSYWNELSGGTHKVGLAAVHINKGLVVYNEPNNRFYSVAENIEIGKEVPPIIVVSNNDEKQGEILEGHLRATGYVLASTDKRPLTAVWGRLTK